MAHSYLAVMVDSRTGFVEMCTTDKDTSLSYSLSPPLTPPILHPHLSMYGYTHTHSCSFFLFSCEITEGPLCNAQVDVFMNN